MEQHSLLGSGTNTTQVHSSASSRATVVLTAMVAALGGLLFGFDTSVISGAMLFLRADFHLSDTQLEFAVGIALAGALVGSAAAGYCTDRWGRRWMLLVTALGFGLFSVLTGLAVGLVSFSVARFLCGRVHRNRVADSAALHRGDGAGANSRCAGFAQSARHYRGHRRGLLR